jgi:hypothetical protein
VFVVISDSSRPERALRRSLLHFIIKELKRGDKSGGVIVSLLLNTYLFSLCKSYHCNQSSVPFSSVDSSLDHFHPAYSDLTSYLSG